jgi:hypothetical protein
MPVKAAIGNMLEGREGGGYKGILAWISKPEIKDWYLKNAGIQTAINATAAAAAAAAAANAAAKCAENASALYAFDGTETNETHRSSIWAVSQRFQGWGDCGRAGGAYIKGPNGIGSDSFDIYQWLYKQACKDVFEKKVRKVYVIGFSRGAINAVRFANQFHECGGGAKVEFVGISDPVNALMVGYDDAKTLVPGRAAHSFMMPKSKNDMNWSVKDNNFYTAAIQGFSKVEIISNREQNSDLFNGDRHWMMNVGRCISGRETEDRYIREMSALGIRFSAQLRPGDEACKM